MQPRPRFSSSLPAKTAIRSNRPPPTPLSELNRSFIILGNSFQSGNTVSSFYQDDFSLQNAPASARLTSNDPVLRPTSPYSASITYFEGHKSTPSLGSFSNDPVSRDSFLQLDSTEKLKKGKRWRLFKSKKSKQPPSSDESEPRTSTSSDYPLDFDPFEDYIGRPMTPPPISTISEDFINTPMSQRKPKARLLRKAHITPPIDVPSSAFEDTEFNLSSVSTTDSDAAPIIVRHVETLPLWAREIDERKALARERRNGGFVCDPEEQEIFFVINPDWDPRDEESVCFEFIDPRLVRRAHPVELNHGFHDALPGRVRENTNGGVIESQVKELRRAIDGHAAY